MPRRSCRRWQRSMVMFPMDLFDRTHGKMVVDEISQCELDLVERIRLTEPIWHLRKLNRAGAIHLLLNQPSGAFVVRDVVDSGNINLVLSVVDQNRTKIKVRHFPIQVSHLKISALHLAGKERHFSDLPALISFYCYAGNSDFPTLVLPSRITEAGTRKQLLAIVADESRVLVSPTFSNGHVTETESDTSVMSCRATATTAADDFSLDLVKKSAVKIRNLSTIGRTHPKSSLYVYNSPRFPLNNMHLVPLLSSSLPCQDGMNGIMYYKSSATDKLSDYEDIWTNGSLDSTVPLSSLMLSSLSGDRFSSKDTERCCVDVTASDRVLLDSESQLRMMLENRVLPRISRVVGDNVRCCGVDLGKYKLRTPNAEKILSRSRVFSLSAAVSPIVISRTETEKCDSQTVIRELQTTISGNIIVSRQQKMVTPHKITNRGKTLSCKNACVLDESDFDFGENSNQRTTSVFRFDFQETQLMSDPHADYLDTCPLCYPSPGYALPYDALTHNTETMNISVTCGDGFLNPNSQSQNYVSSLNFIPNYFVPDTENIACQRATAVDQRQCFNPAVSNNHCRILPRKSQKTASKLSQNCSASVSAETDLNCEVHSKCNVTENFQCFSNPCSLTSEETLCHDPTMSEDYQLPVDALPSETNEFNSRNSLSGTFPLLGIRSRTIPTSSYQPSRFQSLGCRNKASNPGKRRSLRTSYSNTYGTGARNTIRKFEGPETNPLILKQGVVSESVSGLINDASGSKGEIEASQTWNESLTRCGTIKCTRSKDTSLSTDNPEFARRQTSCYDNVVFTSESDILHRPYDDKYTICNDEPLPSYSTMTTSSHRTTKSSSTQYCQPWETIRVSQILPKEPTYSPLQDKKDDLAYFPITTSELSKRQQSTSDVTLDRQMIYAETSSHFDKFHGEPTDFGDGDERFYRHKSPDVIPEGRVPVLTNAADMQSSQAGQQTATGRMVDFMIKFAQNTETLFGTMIQNFIACTRSGKERSPKNVVRNVRQFMNGMKNYVAHQEESTVSNFVKTEVAKMKSFEFLNWDSIMEQALSECIVEPLYDHIYHLYSLEYRRNDYYQLRTTSDNLKFVHSVALSKLGTSYTSSLEAAINSSVHLLLNLEKRLSPTLRFDCIQLVVRLIDDKVQKSGSSKSKLNAVDVEEVCWSLVETLLRRSLVSLMIDVEFTQALVDPSRLTGDGRFHLLVFGCAVHLLKKLLRMEPGDVQNITTRNHIQTILNEVLLSVFILDEKCENLLDIRIPCQPNSIVTDLCDMLAYRVGVGNSRDYGLFLVANGIETRLADNSKVFPVFASPDFGAVNSRLIYKRIGARFIWSTRS